MTKIAQSKPESGLSGPLQPVPAALLEVPRSWDAGNGAGVPRTLIRNKLCAYFDLMIVHYSIVDKSFLRSFKLKYTVI